jgi:hypothetical protein
MTLELTLLTFLRAGAPLLTPEGQLRMDARLAASPPPTGSDISAALNHIEDAGLAVSVRDPLTHAVKWKITDQGRAELAARGI